MNLTKRISLLAFLLLFFVSANFAQIAKTVAMKSPKKQSLVWTSKSAEAKTIANKGIQHIMNAEAEQAYHDLSAALILDRDFTLALACMANLSRGEAKKAYTDRAIKSAANKTPGEKLLVSTLLENKAEVNRETWAKLHGMFPDDAMLGNFYVVTRATPEEKFTAAEEYIKMFPEEPGMYNTLAYYYLTDKKDNEKAKQKFEQYIALYPEGYNPYDSMGEFYVTTGDAVNGEKYYRLALEKYPFATSSLNALQKIVDAKPKEVKKE